MEKIKIIFLEVLLLVGTLVLFYPDISDFVNGMNQTKAVLLHSEVIGRYSEEELEKILSDARDYNKKLAAELNPLYYPDRVKGYEDTLNPSKNGMMGNIIIKKIGVELPIYHGMTEAIIQKSAGHLKGSSLPIGGESTHSVISSHSGLPSARLFTDLRKLEIGDEFIISVLGKELAYRIDQILTIQPNEVEELAIVEGKDYLTMFTCTPYGINSHRLLVRGSRIPRNVDIVDNKEESKEKNTDFQKLKIIAILLVTLIIVVNIIRNIIIFLKKK